MSIQLVLMYTYECDWEECHRSADEDSEYVAWSDEDGAMATVTESDVFQEIGDKYYCFEHWHWDDDGDYAIGPDPKSADSEVTP